MADDLPNARFASKGRGVDDAKAIDDKGEIEKRKLDRKKTKKKLT